MVILIVEKKSKEKISTNELESLTIISEKDDSPFQFYRQASTASKLGVSIKETPASIEILNSELMQQ